MLQSTNLDLAIAVDLVSATIETLEDFRTDSYWDHFFVYAESVARLHSIDVISPRPSRKRKLPSHQCDTVVFESNGSSKANQQFKIAWCHPILDAFVME